MKEEKMGRAVLGLDWSDTAQVRQYMRDYYLAHGGVSRSRIIPGARRQSKTCRRCGATKSRAEFTVRKTGPRVGHLAAYCKPCTSEQQGMRYHAAGERDPGRYRRIEWPSKLRRLYGITVADYDAMLAAQGGGCALCGATSPQAGNRSYRRVERSVFDVDHDHKTGRVRGLLCTRCNRLVGLANDNADTARKLVAYLT